MGSWSHSRHSKIKLLSRISFTSSFGKKHEIKTATQNCSSPFIWYSPVCKYEALCLIFPVLYVYANIIITMKEFLHVTIFCSQLMSKTIFHAMILHICLRNICFEMALYWLRVYKILLFNHIYIFLNIKACNSDFMRTTALYLSMFWIVNILPWPLEICSRRYSWNMLLN